ncbi:hypothetical protein FE782_10620 [Paenibacillus antri]|uniref:Uncharacterized protein n=1 Tax=Paenibacillus antri TaxID=2582848 RepID=A0A5R9G7M0_9BACL|nr:hypothetical protein [Paenibacillus antri]TLS52412.1 hypothetical protein FE782_10620 [Paenibacillus antri]
MMNARGGKEWLTSTFEKYKHEPYYANRSRKNPESHLDFLHEYAEVARSAFVRCDLRSLAIDNTAWDWTSYHTKLLEYFGWSYVPDPIVPEAELAKYAGIYHNEELRITVHVQVRGGQITVFGDQRVRVKVTHAFYMDNVSILIRFIIDPSGECNQFVVEEMDLIGNQKDEGTRFRRIS